MKLIIIVIALVVALVVAYGVSTFVNEKKAEPQVQVLSAPPVQAPAQADKVDIYVAEHDLPIGTVITPADYDIKHWSQNVMPPGAIVYGKDAPKIDGMIMRTSVSKDAPLLTGQLRNPNDPTYIAGQLGEGMRAITVPVNGTSSVAGFVSPGDKVDVLFSFDLIKSQVQGGDVTAMKSASDDHNIAFTEVLMPNVRVLAVDTRVSAELPPQKEGQQQGPPPMPTSVTLEVSQRDAQKLKLAQKMGDLSLVLRSVKDKDNNDIVRPTAEQDLTRIMPPAYFPVLYDNNSNYDFSVVDLYGNTLGDKNCGAMTLDKATGKMVKKCGDNNAVAQPSSNKTLSQNPELSVNIYRGVQLEKVEVNKP